MQLLTSIKAIKNKYGRLTGFLEFSRYRFVQLSGGYRYYQNISWEHVHRLVFICHGNICRSAYADASARHLGLISVSAGLTAKQGGYADPSAIRVAAERNINLASHRSMRAEDLETKAGDLYLCMEPSQASYMQKLTRPNANQQVTLTGLWAEDPRPYLQDPYGLGDIYMNTCFDVIDSALTRISSIIQSDSAMISTDESR